jgi:hypothetical protein
MTALVRNPTILICPSSFVVVYVQQVGAEGMDRMESGGSAGGPGAGGPFQVRRNLKAF